MTALTSTAHGSRPPQPAPGPDWPSVRQALAVAVVGVVVLSAVYAVFVQWPTGQRLDQAGLDHLADGYASRQAVASWLRGVTFGFVAVVMVACVGVAIARRRLRIGIIAVGIVVGANISTQVLKHVIFQRPHLGHGWANSLPSGHTTVVTSVALAALLVTSRRWRGIVSVGAAVAVSVTGVGTVVANWHRPSDVVAGYAVCLVWGAFGLAVVSLRPEAAAISASPQAHPFALLIGLALAAAVFLELGVRPDHTARDFAIHAVIMCGTALAGAAVVGAFTWMANARTS